MFNAANESFSDIVFECTHDIVATSSVLEASTETCQSMVGAREMECSESRDASSSASSSSSSDSLDSDAVSQAPSHRVHAHRCILSASSPYFRTLFSGAWRDSSDGRIVTKHNVRVIRCMLEFLYTGEMTAAKAMQLPFEDLIQLHEAATEFQVEALRAMAEAALAKNVSASNLVRMLQLAVLHDGTSCMLVPDLSSTAATPSSLSSSASSASLSLAPCMLMDACIAVLKDDMALLATQEMARYLGGQQELGSFLRAALAKTA
jgi:hypothetical protein